MQTSKICKLKCVKILSYNGFYEVLVCVYTYMFTYNSSLILLFILFFQLIVIAFKTIHSFNDLKFNPFSSTLTSFALFSMAGVPPFIGFFAKLLLLIVMVVSNFLFFFFFFFTLLFFGLYFYLQNLRFLHSTGQKIQNALNYAYQINLRVSSLSVYQSTALSLYLLFGILFVDDTILYFSWLFV